MKYGLLLVLANPCTLNKLADGFGTSRPNTTMDSLMRLSRSTILIVIPLFGLVWLLWVQNSWRPVAGRIMTRWAEQVSPETAWREYPRPQLVREDWLNLNGLWDYAIVGESKEWTGGRLETPRPTCCSTSP